jgi:outer membrane protein assembly factor BamB
MIGKRTVLLTMILSSILFSQNVPLWEKDLGEPIKEYNFINNDQYLFFTSGEYVWCHDASTGQEIWQMEVPGFEEKGISFLLGEMYLTNSDNKLQAYDALTGKLFWENEYDNIDQGDYRSMDFIKNNAVFWYGDYDIGIDLNTGKELFRMEIDYWGELVDLGSFNYSVLEDQNKMLVMEDSEKATLFDITNGKRLFESEEYPINKSLIEEGFPWLYQSPKDDFLVFVLEEGAALVDVTNNKEVVRRRFEINEDFNVILPTRNGCAIMGEEKFVHFDFGSGETKEFNFSIDDFRTMYTYNTGEKDLLIISMEDRLASIDLAGGKVLWQTKEDDPEFEGYIHRYLMTDGNDLIATYVRATAFSEDNGTYIFLMNIDGVTGQIKYKKPVVVCEGALMGFQRTIVDVIGTAMSTFVTVAGGQAGAEAGSRVTEVMNQLMGYDNIGFEYQQFEYGKDSFVFFAGGNNTNTTYKPFLNPDNRETPGEGFVSINYKTGEINYQTYFDISNDMNDNDRQQLAALNIIDNIVYVAGDQRVIKFDLDSGKKLWETKVEDKFVRETCRVNDILLIRYGSQMFNVNLKETDVELKGTFDQDPYGFIAFKDTDGNILWDKQTSSDPVLLTPQFSIANYTDVNANRLYFADIENLYALNISSNGGSYDWQINFENSGLGEFDFSETYAVIEKWIGSVPRTRTTSTYIGGGWSMVSKRTTGGYNEEAVSEFLDEAESSDMFSTYTSWGNIWGVAAKKCLRILYGSDRMIVFGPEKIALVNSQNGNIIWSKEWDYDYEVVEYVPKVMNGNIIYCMDEQLVLINLENGNEIFRTEVNGDSKFFPSPSEKNLFNLYDEEISAYSLNVK